MTVWALVTLDRRLVQVASVAWLVYSVPHLYYHSTHREPFETGSLVAALTSLTLGVVVPVVLLVMTRQPSPGRDSPTPSAA